MKKFIRALKHFFIPHFGNDYKPHSLRETSVVIVGVIAVLIFFGSVAQYVVITQPNLASVVSAVLVDLTNADRKANALGVLTVNPTLVVAAQEKANDMAAKSYFAHTSPEGLTPWHWFSKNGYRFKYAGENLAVNFSDSAEVERAWMNSPGHRANILNGKFTEVGIAISFGKYDGRDVVFVAQLFGRPSLAAAATAPIARALASETKTAAPAGTPITEQTVRVLSEEISTGDTGPENEIFVAVENASETDEVAAPAEETTAVNVGTNVSALQRLATMPQTTMRYAYFALIAVVLTALFLNIFIEIRRQHPRHILYGILLLVFIGALFYFGQTFVFPQLLVL